MMQGKNGNPLYDCWLAVADSCADAPAVRLPDGQLLTFSALRALGQTATSAPAVLASQSSGIHFILDVLRAWRDAAVLMADETGTMPVPERAHLPAAACHVKITSGSSGARRHVVFAADHLLADANQIVTSMGLDAASPNLAVLSMAHSYGFSNLVLPLLLHGIPLWLVDNPLPETLRRVLAEAKDTGLTLPAVPALWQAWERASVDLSSVRLAIAAGAPLPLALEEAVFLRCGLKIHNFYGSSECGGIAYDRSATPRKWRSHDNLSGYAGTALDGVTLAVNPSSECLEVVSAAAGIAYLDADPCLGAGRFITRDRARLEEDGSVILLGRAGEMISVAGFKVAPAHVEEALARVSGLKACVVFGVPSADPIRVEDLVACINAPTDLPLEVFKNALAGLPSPCMPRHWWLCPELEPDARGKIPRATWREKWLAQSQACG